MRSKRAAFILFCWLAALGVVTVLAYRSAADQSGSVAVLAHSGVTVFGALVGVVVALVMLLVPGLVGGSIAGERERQTLDLLLCTRVRPWRVVVGKLAASLAFMGFLLVASLPILSVVALLGGIAWGDILIVAGLGALTAVTVGSMSILFSAISKGPTGAIVCSYIAMFALLVGPLLLGGYLLAQGIGSNFGGGGFSSSSGVIGPGGAIASPAVVQQSLAPPMIMAISPGMAIGAEVASISNQSCPSGVFNTIRRRLQWIRYFFVHDLLEFQLRRGQLRSHQLGTAQRLAPMAGVRGVRRSVLRALHRPRDRRAPRTGAMASARAA